MCFSCRGLPGPRASKETLLKSWAAFVQEAEVFAAGVERKAPSCLGRPSVLETLDPESCQAEQVRKAQIQRVAEQEFRDEVVTFLK